MDGVGIGNGRHAGHDLCRARGGKPTQLLAVDAITVPRDLVDAQVRIELTTV